MFVAVSITEMCGELLLRANSSTRAGASLAVAVSSLVSSEQPMSAAPARPSAPSTEPRTN